MDDNTRLELLGGLISRQLDESMEPDYRAGAKDTQGLGLLIAHYFKWDGSKIMECAADALEDANFHGEAKMLRDKLEVA